LHHLSKAYESLGIVTFLPGCLTLYRVRTTARANGIIEEYAEPALY